MGFDTPTFAPHNGLVGRRSKLRVWLVDDDPGMRALLVRAMGERFETHVFASSTQALENLATLPPDFVVTDFLLGDGFGSDIARAVRPAPTLLISGTVCQVPEAERELFADILEKPFRLSAFYDAIETMRHGLRSRARSGTAVRDVGDGTMRILARAGGAKDS